MDYHESKVNEVTDTLFRYPKQNAKDETILQAKNINILHCL